MARIGTIEPKHDMGIAKRLEEVRTKYIDKNQGEANKKLGLSRGQISLLERGQVSVTLRFLQKLAPYNINPNYILLGEKPVILKDVEKTNSLLASLQVNDRLDKLERYSKITTANLDKAWELISRHEKTIEALQGKIEQLNRG